MSVEEHTIQLAGSPVFYRTAPQPGDPVLYLHGVPTSSEDWIPFLERTGGFGPDLPGFGRSGKGGHRDYSMTGHADFAAAFLDKVGAQRVSLVLHDWGAAGGLIFAQRHPERIAAIVLINAVPLLKGFHWHRLARVWRRAGLGELAMGSANRWLLARTLRRGGPWPDDRVRTVWDQLDQGTQRAILRLHRSAGEPQLARAGADLSRLDVPALIIWGERDPWIGPQFADAYAAALPRATVVKLAGAGHWPWLDDAGVIDRVAEFLTA